MNVAISNRKDSFRNRIHPQKFALWLCLASITMMFGAFTSAYIVKQAAGNWIEFELPSGFYFSTFTIIVSSVLLQFSYSSFKKNNFVLYKLLLVLATLLGFVFIILQYSSWQTLFEMGIDLKGNPSGSFLYIITGVHAMHVLGGIAAMIVAVIHAFTLREKVTSKRLHRFQLTYNYWHYMGFLWIYLLGFLLLSK